MGGLATQRVCYEKDVSLGGGRLVLPKGTVLHMTIHSVMMSPHNWADPDAFIPERFLEVCYLR